jgi:death-on-curing protein
VGLLNSVVAQPRSSAFGNVSYLTEELKAAALFHSLENNRPLVDGDKRLAWLDTDVLFDIKNFEVGVTDDEAFQLVWGITNGHWNLLKCKADFNRRGGERVGNSLTLSDESWVLRQHQIEARCSMSLHHLGFVELNRFAMLVR